MRLGAAEHQSIFHVCVAVGEPLASQTDVSVLRGHVSEGLLAEAHCAFALDVIGFGGVTVMPAFLQARMFSPLK